MPHIPKILPQNLRVAEKAIQYFTCQVTNPDKFENVKQVALENNSNEHKTGLIELGYLSLSDYYNYLSKTKQVGNGIQSSFVQGLIHSLESHNIIHTLPEGLVNSNEMRYKASGEYTKFLFDRGLILNLVCGWKYIIERYSKSVLKIEHINSNDDYSIGTGFYFAVGNKKTVKHLIITNKHVVEKAKLINVLTKENERIEYSDIKIDPKRDLAFIVLNKNIDAPIFHLNTGIEILSEILTIGYPSIPMTKEAYQVYHKGELNSFVEDYYDNKLFLFSAKTSSGNSGSPIIDEYGMVIGIATEELFEKDAFYLKGKLPYYAGIPTQEITNSINENLFMEK